MTTKTLHCINKNNLLWLFLSLFLSGCLGGGGSSTETVVVVGTSLVLLPTTTNASGSVALTALVKDSNNVPLAEQTISFSFAEDNTETLSPQTAVTDAQGTATVTVTDIGNDGGLVTVQAQYQDLLATAQVNFIRDTAEQALQLTAQARILAVGESSLVEVRLVDAQGFPQSGRVLNFSVTGQATLDRDRVITDDNGYAPVNVSNTVAENVRLDVRADALQASVTLYFGGSLRFFPVDSRAFADGTTAVPLTVQLLDAAGSAIVGETVQFFSLQGSPELEFFSAETGQNGQVVLNVVNRNVETSVIGVRTGALSRQATVHFLGSGVDQNLRFTASTTILPIGETVLLDVWLLDEQGLPQVGQVVRFAVSGQARLDASNVTTDSDGRVQVSVTGTAAENVQVTISAGALQERLTLYFGASLRLFPSDSTAPADGVTSALLTTQLLDAAGSAIVGETVQFFSLQGSPELEFFSAETGQNGQVVLNVVNRNVETSVIGVQVGSLPQLEARIEFETPTANTGDLDIDQIELIADKKILNVGSEALIQVALRQGDLEDILSEGNENAQRNLLPNTPFSASVSHSAELLDVPTATDGNGLAIFRLTNKQAENVTLTVTSGGINSTLKLYFGGSLELLPNSISASGSQDLIALLKDANNALIIGEKVSFTPIGSSVTLEPAEALTGNDGSATVTVTDITGNGGVVTVQARSDELSDEAQINFFANLGDNRSLEASVDRQILGVGQSATVQARVFDDNGFPVAGFPVNFFQNQQLLTTLATDDNGLVRVPVSQSNAASERVEVRAGSATQSFTLYFGTQLSLSPANSHGVADGKTPVLLNVILRDADGVGIAGQRVDFRLDSGNAMLDVFNLITDEQGRGTLNLTARQVGEAVLLASSGGVTANPASIRFASPGIPAQISLQSATLPGALSLNANDSITATVLDELGHPMVGIPVNFSTSGVGSIESTALTKADGTAQVTFNALTTAGISTITASVNGADNQPLSSRLSLTVQPGGAGVIELVSVEPSVIGIRGSGVVQSATLTFVVKDALGNTLNNANVNFSLGNTQLGGGESISTSSANTIDGFVSVSLQSGNVAGVVDVVARVDNANISTLGRVSIVGGIPDARHLSLAAEYLNIAGGVTLGLQNRITAFVGDRFGNVVPDNTPINFISEGGTIGVSPNAGGFTSTTEFGQASAILQSAVPTTPDLGGFDHDGDPSNNNPGFNRIVAYTSGSESFIDSNGNGQYDAGEPFDDLSEPFIDANDSGAFEPSELYIDVNGNNVFDLPDGVFQDNTTIWTSMNVLFSGHTETDKEKVRLTVRDSECQNIDIQGIQDIYGNPLVSGTRLEVSTSFGTLTGTTAVELADQTRGQAALQFGLEPQVIEGETKIETTTVLFSLNISASEGGDSEAGNDNNAAPGNNGNAIMTWDVDCNIEVAVPETETANTP